MIRKSRAVWRGSGRDGNGDLSTDSGVLENTPYSFRTRFENEKGTNPEELIAAAHAGCFTMDQDTFDRLAQDAEQNCPVSRVLRAEITLGTKLV
jgi:organic hydroperoxide reductase OsmC/OhrA